MPFNRELLNAFLKDFLPDYQLDERPVRTPDKSILTEVTQLGVSRKVEVTVLEAECEENDTNQRIAITQAAFKILRDHGIRNAIVAFHVGTDQWRLSLLTSTLEIKDGKVIKKNSNPRRYSYLLGVGAKTNTPRKFLIEKGRVENIKQLQERFSVEVVNKHFYASVADLFTKLVGGERGATKYPGLLKINTVVSQNVEHQEFAVRLIGRIIFSWFLKEKKSAAGVAIVPNELLSLDAVASNADYYHSILEPLFFELLNKRIENRHESLREAPFSNVPYLNGGLFSPQRNDFYSQNSFNGAGTPGLTHIPDSWFNDLFTVLEQYNFTVDENTSYDVDLSIDPEMLGRIFENLLAEINPETGESARKSTGSFYTPREIVDYMVDSSLLEFLKNKTNADEVKLKALISWGKSDDDEYPLSDTEKQRVVNALAELTILDPACGSGAFPIGILQKVVYILQQVDEKAELWLQTQLKAINSPELRRDIESKYLNGNFDYLRKLGVIRESIFGIDIQSIATEISKLRCFLTLIIDEDVQDNQPNRGVRALPNLDFKFVTANSLAGLPRDPVVGQSSLLEDTAHIDELKRIRDEYFTAPNDLRAELKNNFYRLQKEMFNTTIHKFGGTVSGRYSLLSSWDPFEHTATKWFDSEWMFGIDRFDIVIGNPPYIDSETMVKVMPGFREIYKENYEVARGNWDLYIVFYGLTLNQLKESGIGCLITPNQWLTLQYGKALRTALSNRILNFADMRTYSDFTASVNTFVTIFTKQPRRIEEKVEYRLFSSTGSYQANVMTVEKLSLLDNFGILTSSNYPIIEKLNKLPNKCSMIFHYGSGYVVNDYYILTDLIKNNPSPDINKEFKLVNTGLLTKDIRQTNWGIKELKHINKYEFPVVNKKMFASTFPRKISSQDTVKVIVSESSGIKVFVDEYGQYLADKVTLSIIPNHESDVWLIGHLLDSRLFRWYYDQVYSAGGMMGTTVNGAALELMPLPSIIDLESLRKQLTKENDNADVNRVIYSHYNLTAEDITIIESS